MPIWKCVANRLRSEEALPCLTNSVGVRFGMSNSAVQVRIGKSPTGGSLSRGSTAEPAEKTMMPPSRPVVDDAAIEVVVHALRRANLAQASEVAP